MNKNITKATLIAAIIFVVSYALILIGAPTIGPVRLWLLWPFFIITYFAFSWRWWDPVKEDERAARIFFGQNAGEVDPGVPYAPLGLVQVRALKVSVTQREFPGNPTEVYKGDLSVNPDVNLTDKVLPIRIPFRSMISDEEARKLFGADYCVTNTRTGAQVIFNANVPDDGLTNRITAELYMIVRFTPRDIYQFVRNIGDIDHAIKQIEDEMVSTATQFLGRMSYAQAIANMRWLDIILYHAVERRTGARDDDNSRSDHSWGIEIHDVRIKSIELDHDTNKSIRDAAAANFKASATITAAEAAKRAAILEGEGAAQAAYDITKKTLDAQAAGQKKIAEDLGLTGAEVQAAEIARAVAENGNTVIIGQEGFGQLAGIVGAMINKKPAPEKKGAETQE
jgi:regulator of protease activity HflC (stomatin/prohibitin superfamily)